MKAMVLVHLTAGRMGSRRRVQGDVMEEASPDVKSRQEEREETTTAKRQGDPMAAGVGGQGSTTRL